MKEKIREYGAKAAAFITLATARANYMIHCDAFDDAEQAVGTLKDKLITLAEYLFPLAIVICAIAMFFTRDQKKFDTEKHIMIGCCLAFALVIVVEKGHLVDTVRNLFN